MRAHFDLVVCCFGTLKNVSELETLLDALLFADSYVLFQPQTRRGLDPKLYKGSIPSEQVEIYRGTISDWLDAAALDEKTLYVVYGSLHLIGEVLDE